MIKKLLLSTLIICSSVIAQPRFAQPIVVPLAGSGSSVGTVTNLTGGSGITVTPGDPIVISQDGTLATVASVTAAQLAATNYADSIYDYSVNLGGFTTFTDKHNNRQLRKIVVIGDSIADPAGTSLSGSYFLRSIVRDGEAGAGLMNRANILLKNPSPLAAEQWMGTFYGTWWTITNGGNVTWSNATPGGMLCNQVGTWWETTNATDAQLFLQVSTNGGTFTTIATLNASNSTPIVRYTNVSLTLTNYRVRVVATNALISVFGVETINTNIAGAVSYQLDASGFSASSLVTGINNVSNVVALLQPDLVWIQFKDRGDVTDTALSNNMAVAYSALNTASGGKLFVSGAWYKTNDIDTNWSKFETQVDSWAAQTYGWSFFDTTYHTKSYSNQVNQGWMGDTTHFNTTGASEVGRVMQDAIGLSWVATNTIAESLVGTVPNASLTSRSLPNAIIPWSTNLGGLNITNGVIRSADTANSGSITIPTGGGSLSLAAPFSGGSLTLGNGTWTIQNSAQNAKIAATSGALAFSGAATFNSSITAASTSTSTNGFQSRATNYLRGSDIGINWTNTWGINAYFYSRWHTNLTVWTRLNSNLIDFTDVGPSTLPAAMVLQPGDYLTNSGLHSGAIIRAW